MGSASSLSSLEREHDANLAITQLQNIWVPSLETLFAFCGIWRHTLNSADPISCLMYAYNWRKKTSKIHLCWIVIRNACVPYTLRSTFDWTFVRRVKRELNRGNLPQCLPNSHKRRDPENLQTPGVHSAQGRQLALCLIVLIIPNAWHESLKGWRSNAIKKAKVWRVLVVNATPVKYW